MRLNSKHKVFKTDEITYLDRKSIQLDRMMLRLFRLLRFDGRADVSLKKVTVTLDSLEQLLVGSEDRFPGFNSHPEIARAWLRSDLLEIMNRGKVDREAVVGPRPLHLNAYKLTVPSAVQDYGASDQVWAMLYHADPQVLNLLSRFSVVVSTMPSIGTTRRRPSISRRWRSLVSLTRWMSRARQASRRHL